MVRHKPANHVRARLKTWNPTRPLSWRVGDDCLVVECMCFSLISFALCRVTAYAVAGDYALSLGKASPATNAQSLRPTTLSAVSSKLRRIFKVFFDQLFAQVPEPLGNLGIRRIGGRVVVLAIRKEASRRFCQTVSPSAPSVAMTSWPRALTIQRGVERCDDDRRRALVGALPVRRRALNRRIAILVQISAQVRPYACVRRTIALSRQPQCRSRSRIRTE